MVCHVSHPPLEHDLPFEVCVRLTASSLARTWGTGIFQNICASSLHSWTTLPHSRYWLHAVPKRIVCTIGSETSTTTRHRDTNTPTARWSHRVSVAY